MGCAAYLSCVGRLSSVPTVRLQPGYVLGPTTNITSANFGRIMSQTKWPPQRADHFLRADHCFFCRCHSTFASPGKGQLWLSSNNSFSRCPGGTLLILRFSKKCTPVFPAVAM